MFTSFKDFGYFHKLTVNYTQVEYLSKMIVQIHNIMS